MRDKQKIVLIASGGRTGTTFLGNMLSDVIRGSFSVHEPDLLDGVSPRTWKAVRQFGFYHMIIGRILGRTGIRNLAQRYLAGDMSFDKAVAAVRNHRRDFYRSIDAGLIVEAYSQWFGLLPVAREAFPDCRLVGIVRDPRTWVQSWSNYGGRFDSKDNVRRFGQRRIDPHMLGDAEYMDKWQTMSPFAKNCWHWKVIAELILKEAEENPLARCFRFEDLFSDANREVHMKALLDFIVKYDDRQFEYELPEGFLDKVANRSYGDVMDHWQHWPEEQKLELAAICGPVMKQLGYGTEADWPEIEARG